MCGDIVGQSARKSSERKLVAKIKAEFTPLIIYKSESDLGTPTHTKPAAEIKVQRKRG